MKTVRIYYAGIPVKNTKREKRDMLTLFHQGVGSDGSSKEIETANWEASDLAVLQGWVHVNSGRTPHLMFRRQVIDNQKRIGKHTLAIDSNLFLYRDPSNARKYFRYSLDDVFPTTGNYFTDHVDPSRWQQIKRDIGFDLQPWRESGNHILICLQRNGGWSMAGVDVMEWCNHTIKKIKKYSDRKIVVRAHPGDRRAKEYLKLNWPNVEISNKQTILDDFKNCWAVVTYNSSPGVAAAIEGIPVFVTDPNPMISQAYDVCNTKLKNIENPKMPERQSWIEKISMSHYSFDDLRKGVAWDVVRNYI